MKKFFLLFAVLFIPALNANAWWSSYKTGQFTVLYYDGYEKPALELLSAMERYKAGPEALTGNKCNNLPIVLEDFGQYSNGVTNPIGNVIHDFVYYDGSMAVENWMRTVGLHEYTHMCQMSKTGGAASVLSWFSTALRPNIFYPDWFTEGLAVYSESQFSKFEGRLNDGLFDSYIGARAADARLPQILEATYQPLEYPSGTGAYIYGGNFLRYLAKKYGPEKFAQLLDLSGGSIASYFTPLMPMIGLDSFARQVYGKSMPELWDDWTVYELDRQMFYGREGERVTFNGWNTNSPVFSAGRLYYIRNYPVKSGAFRYYWFNEIVELDTGSKTERVIASNNASYVYPLRPAGKKLYYAMSRTGGGYPNALARSGGVTTAVYEHDLSAGTDREILYGDIRAFCAPRDGSLIYAVQKKLAQGCDILSFECGTGKSEELFSTDMTVDELACGGEKIVAACQGTWEQQGIFGLDLQKKSFVKIIDTAYYESMPYVTADGKTLFFTANYGGRYSAYCYDFGTGKVQRATENGVAMYPSYDPDSNKIYFNGMTSYGHDIFSEKFSPVEFTPPDEEPGKEPEGFLLKEGEYQKGGWLDDIATMYPVHRYPVAQLDGEKLGAFGMGLQGGDAIGYFNYTAESYYDINKKRPLYNLDFSTFLITPAQIHLTYNDVRDYEDRSLYLDVNTPIIADTPSGLTGLHAGVETGLIKGLTRTQVTPYINSNIDYPGTGLYLSLSSPVETARFGEYYRMGVYGDMSLNHYLGWSEVIFKLHGIYDPDITDDTAFSYIRGYSDKLVSKEGVTASVDLTRPVIKVHSGMWNPNFYMEDLCGGVFIDTASGKGADSQVSGGFELHLETRFLLLVNADLGYRLAINKDGDFTAEPVLSVGTTF